MASSRAPSPGALGTVEIAHLVEEHAEVERGVGVASALGSLARCERSSRAASLMEHRAEVERAGGGAALVGAAVGELFELREARRLGLDRDVALQPAPTTRQEQEG